MSLRNTFALAILAAFLGGCVTAPQAPVALLPDSVSASSGRIGIATSKLPIADTQILGAGCLLCYGTAVAANSSLTDHAKTLPPEGIPELKGDLLNLLAKKGANPVIIPDPIDLESLSSPNNEGPGIARKDFTPLKTKYNIDKLLLIEVEAIGFHRTYAQYFPTSDPKAYFRGKGSLVNLKNNTYEWYMPVQVFKSADKNWDEPPKFPGLTNAYFQTLEIVKDQYRAPFKN